MSTATDPPRVAGRLRPGLSFGRDPTGAMEAWAREGDIVRVDFLADTRYLVTHPEPIEDVLLRDQHKYTISRDQQTAFAGVEDHAMTTATGEHWNRLRRASHPAFTRERITAYGDRMGAVSARFVDGWTEGETVDLHPELRRLSVQLLGETLLDVDLRGRESVLIDAADAVVAKSDFSRPGQVLPDWVPTPTDRRFRRTVGRLHTLVEDLVADRQANRRDDARDVCSVLFEAHEAGALSLEEIRDNLSAFMLAGHESPSGALTRAWYLIADRPDVRQRLREEYGAVVDGPHPTAEDYDALTLTGHVIDETLRLYPPTTGVARASTEPVTLGGYEFPAGSSFLLPQWVPHRDERWWDRPTTFDPNRWGEAAPERPEFAYFPFSGGPRTCIGNDFARQALTLALATMVGRVRLDIDAERPMTFRPSIQLRPTNRITATVEGLSDD